MMTRHAIKPPKLEHTPWQIVTIAQTNIIEEIQFEGFNRLIKMFEGISKRMYGIKNMRRAMLY